MYIETESLEFYEPLTRKIKSWIWYNNNKPSVEYKKSPEVWDEFRAKNDLDCVLADGDLNADTIFSLWLPLRFTLVAINGYAKLKQLAGSIDKRYEFLENLLKEEVLYELLPADNSRVQNLVELFELGQTGANVMILPERWMQKRGSTPYYDYMPYFLSECFEGGEFFRAFKTEEDFIQWIGKQKLEMFFDGKIEPDFIIDLSGTGDIKKGIPIEVDVLVKNYIAILKKRKACLL